MIQFYDKHFPVTLCNHSLNFLFSNFFTVQINNACYVNLSESAPPNFKFIPTPMVPSVTNVNPIL